MRVFASATVLLLAHQVCGAPPGINVPYNGLAKTPPMGWSAGSTSDRDVREAAGTLVRNGMKDAGYVYVHIGDGWQGRRDANGAIAPNERFPDMKTLADFLHTLGLKFGIYSSPGPRTCDGHPGSFEHEELDARTFAAWGADYLTYDWCSAGKTYDRASMPAAFAKMGLALLAAGRPVVYSIAGSLPEAPKWAAATGANLWPTAPTSEAQAAPGHWNDPGALGATDRAQFSLWCILAAPLMAGGDLRSLPPGVLEILTNHEAIAVDQDPLGAQGTLVKKNGDLEMWVKPLADGGAAVGLFNRGGAAARITIGSSDLGIKTMPKVRDLWTHEDRAEAIDTYSADVPAHGAALLRVGGN